jgi:hypothetical protein
MKKENSSMERCRKGPSFQNFDGGGFRRLNLSTNNFTASSTSFCFCSSWDGSSIDESVSRGDEPAESKTLSFAFVLDSESDIYSMTTVFCCEGNSALRGGERLDARGVLRRRYASSAN